VKNSQKRDQTRMDIG